MTQPGNSASVVPIAVRASTIDAYPRKRLGALGALALISLVLQYGFPVGVEYRRVFNWFDVALAICLGTLLVKAWRASSDRPDLLQRHWFDYSLLVFFVVGFLLSWVLPGNLMTTGAELFHLAGAADLRFGWIQLFLLANVCLQMLRHTQQIFLRGVRPELALASSFASLILIGTLLLLLPRVSARPEAPVSLIDGLFTATSAACVTGLVVRDTGTDFSTLGQMIILALFQIGGLGIITFVAFISVFSEKRLPVPQMVTFRQIINAPGLNDLKMRLAGIALLTVLFETAGAISLFYAYPVSGDTLGALKWSVFHSVSAFCNAGFALQADSLEFAVSHPGINVTIMALIVLGGLGFLAIPEMIVHVSATLKAAAARFGPGKHKFLRPRRPRLSVQTRLSLWMTLWLALAGFLGFWGLEANHTLSGSGAGERLMASAFQSITARTAGFNTVMIGDLQPATLILLIMLMVIGGCPVSAAGGIKTVTFAILLLSLRTMIFQSRRVEAFGRALPQKVLIAALSVFVLYIMTAAACFFLVSVFDPQIPARDQLFEVISALSTVGLSTGITAELSTGSKLVLCVAMFIGRVGPISLVISVFQARTRMEYEYPSEEVVVG